MLGVGVDGALRCDRDHRAGAESLERRAERRTVTLTATDRDLIEGPQHPSMEPSAEELRGDQEARRPGGPRGEDDRQGGPIEGADVIEREERRSARGHVLEA